MLHPSGENPRFGETHGFHLQKKLTLQSLQTFHTKNKTNFFCVN